MHILLITACHPYFGGWYRTDNIARQLTTLGHTVRFIHNRKYHRNLIVRLLIGLKNCWWIIRGGYDRVHIFELIPPETLLPGLLARLLNKKVVIDLGDQWGIPPPRGVWGSWVGIYLQFLDAVLARHYGWLTATSDFLAEKIRLAVPTKKGQILKLINGVNLSEFNPLDKEYCRFKLSFDSKSKILLSFGNTYEGERFRLLQEVCQHVIDYIPDIKFFNNRYLNKEELPLYLGACDLVLFPTGGADNEKACFPIRVGTYLNGERVIATDNSPTEFHNTLKPFNCMITGKNPREIAQNIHRFFTDRVYREELEYNVFTAKRELSWENLIGGLDEFYKAMEI